MPASLVYRTNDNTRWGGGQGSDLSAVTIDLNFWTLFSAVQALEEHAEVGAGIDFITQPTNGNIFFIHLTDHRVLGPFTIPTAQWNPRGTWQTSTNYSLYDVVAYNGALYLVIFSHKSSSVSFSPFANDGLGHDFYALLLDQPANELPVGGSIHQRLVKASGSPFKTEWLSDLIRMFVFVSGQPSANELLLQYTVVDNMTLPAGLVGSVAFSHTPTASNVQYTLAKNGAAIGSINFNGPSPETITVAFGSDIDLVPGDIITLNGPAVPDLVQADISITLVAVLT